MKKALRKPRSYENHGDELNTDHHERDTCDEEAQRKEIRRIAFALLARRDYCQHEFTQKLLQKGYADHLVDAVLQDLIRLNFIDNHRYIENFIRARRNKGYGPKRIALELKTHKMEDDFIAEHLNISDNAWRDEIQAVWRKKFKGKVAETIAERMKQRRYLQYRGYTHEQIEELMRDD